MASAQTTSNRLTAAWTRVLTLAVMPFLSKVVRVRRVQLQVLRAVVGRVMVPMMHPFLSPQRTAKQALHHKQMLKDVAVRSSARVLRLAEHHVALPRLGVATSTPTRIRFAM